MSLTNPYALASDHTQVMLLSLLFNPNPRSILMLGLGGGSLPKFLWKSFPRCQIDVVERSPLVADVCYRYFALPQSPRIQVHLTDALHFMESADARYDLLFIDIFDSEKVPEWLGHSPFLALCKKRLKDQKSLLVWNFFSDALAPRFLRELTASFGRNILLLPTKNGRNFIALASPKPLQLPAPLALLQRMIKLEKKLRFPFSQVWDDVQKIISAANL